MSIRYEEVREIMGREYDEWDHGVLVWNISGLRLTLNKETRVLAVQTAPGAPVASVIDASQLRHILAGFGVRAWDGPDESEEVCSEPTKSEILAHIESEAKRYEMQAALLRNLLRHLVEGV